LFVVALLAVAVTGCAILQAPTGEDMSTAPDSTASPRATRLSSRSAGS